VLEMVVVIGWAVMIALGNFPGLSRVHGHRGDPALLDFHVSPRSLAVREQCCFTPPCTLTHFGCSLVVSFPTILLSVFLSEYFGRRPKASGTA